MKNRMLTSALARLDNGMEDNKDIETLSEDVAVL